MIGKQHRLVFLDIETNTKHDKIWCCVTKTDGVIECHTEPTSLRKLLKKTDTIVGHNAQAFDIYLLNKLWGFRIKRQQVLDTLILSRLLNPSRDGGHSLAAFGARLNFLKNDFTDYDAGLSDEMIQYCIRDVELLEKVYYALEHEKQSLGFSDQSIDLEHKVGAIISRQERRGFRLDVPFAMVLASTLRDKAGAIEKDLQSVFPPIVTKRYSDKTGKQLKDNVEVFNPGSRQQIAKRLIEKGWKPQKFTEKGQAIVDETVLSKVAIPEAQKVAEYLLLQKRVAQVSSWLEAVSDDGRVHGRVITNGAVTGRMTHHSPNMAQVPSSSSPYGEECRSCWTVDEGYKLVGIDASGLELRMLAHYMKDEDYVREVCEGDIHTKNQNAAGLPTRPQAKTFIYAFLYGAGAAKIGSIVDGGAKEGQRLIDSFLNNTPSLKSLRAKIERMAEKGYLSGLDGRQLQVRSAHSALNTLLQGAGAIVMKQALVILDESIKNHYIDAHFVANVHDEWQIEVAEEDAELVGKLGVQAIKKAGEVLELRCPLTGEFRVGNNWKETH
jgi:DNA polymerase I-like protein with 3'-5' exonuclease and polymerase domains